ncbi:MAG: hypothetical protein A3J93_04955 [Candidatus Magasanikbacteria bacterium RIFOXYC2_FULL_42_28]|uniref:ABC transporter permease n=1 Tax=Candidatus Magasanikbacteria bacterium RIFOXYC2_FULL_42_28 TaxID=1798704 RepID=A0A1F6NWQ6_9BACT|nr:MAG: hypothetical protein A3J93_04955 [Candidatus Magasanikbacteria bacterium RIFOXYC2_FULL_42_28]
MFWQILINGLIAGSIYALMAMSFSLIYSGTKFFNMTHGVMAITGGYLVYLGTKILGLNPALSIILSIIATGALGLLLNLIIFEPLKKRHSTNVALLVASLGAMTMIVAFLAIFFTNQFQTLGNSLVLTKIYHLGPAVITQTQVIIIICALMVLIGLSLILKFTKFGKMTRAINDNEEVATIVGIDTKKILRYIFFLGSAIAGGAGILMGYDVGLEPHVGLWLLLKGVIAAIIGGFGSIPGAFIGGYIIGLTENFGIWKISGEWKDAVAFIILIIFLLFRQRGLFGKR